MTNHTVYLLLGSNQGNRQQYLQQAINFIAQQCGSIVRSSAIYQTAAWGKTDQPAFLNQVVELHTSMDPDACMHCLLGIENEMGRIRTERMGPRIIDIDLLFYDQLVYHSPVVHIPHPAIAQRRFVLTPMADLNPALVHPVLQQSIAQLLEKCTDPLPVAKY